MNEYRIKYLERALSDKTDFRKSLYSKNCFPGVYSYITNSLNHSFNDVGIRDRQIKSLLFERKEDGSVEIVTEFYPDIPTTQFITITEDTLDEALDVFRNEFPCEEILKVELVEDEI